VRNDHATICGISALPYIPRTADAQLERLLRAAGAVVVEGPKACGKTRTARQVAASEVLLASDENAQTAARLNPALLFPGETPRLLDEWQTVPKLWNALKDEVDRRQAAGQFVLTGSAVPVDDLNRHTGAMRIVRLQMRPMSLHESGMSDGSVSLAALLDGEPVAPGSSPLTISQIAIQIGVGGWPSIHAQKLAPADALEAVRGYVDQVRRTDIQRVDGVARDPDRVLRLMQSLARNVATYVDNKTLATGTANPAGGQLDRDTVGDYLRALERMFVIEDQPAWAPHLRSKWQLRSSPKRHFTDPSMALAALRSTPERALNEDTRYFGFLFESLTVRDLRIYAQAADAEVRQYRDNRGLEVDAVVQSADGRWAAFEVKLGTAWIDDAAENLKLFAKQIDTDATGKMGALAVIVGEGYAYTRPDGIAVIPVGMLGP
jgi:predicted AAA+ superfamily ATPase